MTDLGKRLVGSAAAILIGMSIAHAQGKLSEGAILKSLAGAGEAARAANLNIDALRRDVEKRIQEEGTENAASPPPALQALAMVSSSSCASMRKWPSILVTGSTTIRAMACLLDLIR